MLAALSTANVAAITVAFAHLLFNICGILIIWPIKNVRRLPILMAEFAAAMAIKNRFLPLLFILLVFFIIPLILIVTTR